MRAYDTSKPTKEIRKALNYFKKDQLSETLEFLSRKKVLDKLKKPEVLDALIMKVKNYFPDICSICDSKYTYNINDEPFLACSSCGQEVHKKCYFELFKSMNLLDDNELIRKLIFDIPGFHYLCPTCESQIVSNQDKEVDTGDSAKPNNDKISDSLTNIDRTSDDNKSIDISKHKEVTKEDLEKDKHDRTMYRKDYDDLTAKKLCKFYKRGNCKFGRKGLHCPFDHPKACRKLLQHGNKGANGCKDGNKCINFHPKMCPDSIKNRTCFDLQCNLVHVKGTQRKRIINQNNLNNEQFFETNETKLQKAVNKNQNNENLNFLEIIQNFKKEIFEQLESKLANLVHIQTQHQLNQIHHPHQPQQFQTNITQSHPRNINQIQQFPIQNMRPMFPPLRPQH